MSVIMPIVIRFLHASRRLGAKMCIFMTGVSNQPGVFCGDPYAVSHKMAGSLMKMGMQKSGFAACSVIVQAARRFIQDICGCFCRLFSMTTGHLHKTHIRIN
ncbi:hypothetical protein [Rhizobium sp. AG207R]|uniref:hypothetical protein n=1 Tax=Rhizobium sp. AG207R TaxID=2802287 RepID=UPI0022ABD3EC|nr:hypothetical protein [Rhizobium sp. AG207R]MCZ3375770.1 hypothetical protein [Rhizobium sp. AG207R]